MLAAALGISQVREIHNLSVLEVEGLVEVSLHLKLPGDLALERAQGDVMLASAWQGDNAGATGWLVGEPHRGLAAMFLMMNSARLHVGLQGLGHQEIATQNALRYAAERKPNAWPDRRPVMKALLDAYALALALRQ